MDQERDWRKLLAQCLDSTIVGTIATSGDSGPSASPVYFIYDGSFNIYFISSDATRHVLNIKKNPNVGISIYNPEKAARNVQEAVEIAGTAKEISEAEMEDVYKERGRRISSHTMFTYVQEGGHFVRGRHGVFVRVVPSEIMYINSDIFEGNVMPVPLPRL